MAAHVPGQRNWHDEYHRQGSSQQQQGNPWRRGGNHHSSQQQQPQNRGWQRYPNSRPHPQYNSHQHHHNHNYSHNHNYNHNRNHNFYQRNGFQPRPHSADTQRLMEVMESRRAQMQSPEELQRLQQLKAEDEKKIKEEGEAWKSSISRPPPDNRIRTEDVQGSKQMEFEHFKLNRNLLKGIYEMGWEQPTPIQEDSIPLALQGHDIVARAKNGTGKTASFIVPVLQRVDAYTPHIQAVVIVPTRELALQTSHIMKNVSKYLRVEVMVSTGGTSLSEDIMRLMNPVHVIVATPGRLLDLANRNVAKMDKVRMLVLDEADKLLSDNFQGVMADLLEYIPNDRQMLLFSATYPESVRDFQRTYMHPRAHLINKMEELTLKGITQFYAYLEEKEKVACIAALFKKLNINQSIIFCKSVVRVELLAQAIVGMGSECLYIHAKMDQEERNEVFHRFRNGQSRHLVATDLVTRGIDIQSVNVVINFDFPQSAETYLHRVGRAGRFGHLGIAINLITEADKADMFRIETELDCTIDPIPKDVDEALYCA